MAHASFSLIAGALSLHPSQTPSPLGAPPCQQRPRALRPGSARSASSAHAGPCLEYPSCSLPGHIYSLFKAQRNVATSGQPPDPPGNIPLGLTALFLTPGAAEFSPVAPPGPSFSGVGPETLLPLTLKLR